VIIAASGANGANFCATHFAAGWRSFAGSLFYFFAATLASKASEKNLNVLRFDLTLCPPDLF
jgi:hypothetical protein